MKKSLSVLGAVLIATSLFIGCKKEEEKEITLVMAEVNPSDTVSGRMDTAFKEKVEELSNGKIKIDLYFSGVLGDEKQVMAIMMAPESNIQLTRGPANLSSYSGGKQVKSRLISIPYTFSSDEHFWKFANSDLAEQILNEPYELGLGVKGLFYAQEGLRHYFSNQEIKTVEDLKGKKMRVSGQVLKALSDSFGSQSVEVKFTDLYASFQTGAVEVAEQPISNYLSNSFNQVAPYLVLDGHMIGAISVMVNSECWDSLTAKQQNILTEAGKYASDFCRQIMDEANELAMVILKSEGVKVTEIQDIAPWQNACSQMRKEAASIDSELYQKILDLGK
ncbi:MAG: TRAP transporter substrate-binding protein [Treponema sp.]|nr:TRAP transporter substrate-binding protein [Treponema sp.]